MKRLFAILAITLLAGAATAEPSGNVLQPGVTQVCLDVDGSTLPVTCQSNASLINSTQNICQCHAGARVDAPVCAPGERAPGEDVRYNRARRDAARDGSLIGDTYRGAPMCVDLRAR